MSFMVTLHHKSQYREIRILIENAVDEDSAKKEAETLLNDPAWQATDVREVLHVVYMPSL